ncbi:MAG: peptidylprolyl isomerase [Pseudonocardia sp.]|nr:peptidylprolyl isomerase [Pseudonocardia sp.]
MAATNEMRREAAKRKLAGQQERREQQAKRSRTVAVVTSAVVVVVVVVGVVLLSTLGGSGEATDPAAAPPSEGAAATTTGPDAGAAPVTPESIPTAVTPLPVRSTPLPATATCTYPTDGQPPAKAAQPPAGADISAEGTVTVTLTTSAGAIPLTLDRALAPCTVNSFLSLAQQAYFDGSPCHRLTTSPGLQVLQCGDPTGTGTGGPGYTIPDEVFPELTYGRGILAMAKTAAPDSGGSQFFMVYGDGQLPPEYTAFGSISPEGLQVVDAIAAAGHDGSFDAQAGGGAPVQPVTIQTATVG